MNKPTKHLPAVRCEVAWTVKFVFLRFSLELCFTGSWRRVFQITQSFSLSSCLRLEEISDERIM